MKKLFFLLLFYPLTAIYSHAETPLTLEQAYERALKQSESLQRAQEQYKIAEAQYREAVAALLPNITANFDQRYRSSSAFGSRSSSSTTDDDLDGSGSSGRTSNRSKDQRETIITLQQPLFTGFRDILISRAAKSEMRATALQEKRSRELLMLDVSDLFNQVHIYQQEIEVFDRVEKVLNDRMKELENFITLGRSRDSEILSAQSDLADIVATRESSRGLLGATKELLGFLVGLPTDSFTIAPDSSGKVELALEHYIERSKLRYDLQAADELLDSAQKRLTAAEREHWPSIALEGSAYPYDDPDLNREWDVFLRMSVPIFQGGAIQARVAQSQSTLRIQQLNRSELLRMSERDVRVAFNDLKSARKRNESLVKLYEARIKDLDAQRKDYELGVVTNLEVLDAIRESLEAKRRQVLAEAQISTNLVRLEVAAGGVQ